jgi:hypothetical protein
MIGLTKRVEESQSEISTQKKKLSKLSKLAENLESYGVFYDYRWRPLAQLWFRFAKLLPFVSKRRVKREIEAIISGNDEW